MADDIALDDLPQPAFEGTLPPDDLSTDGDNPNEMTDEQFGLLCDRMGENGWLGGPIVTNTDGLIADGEHRWRAAQKIGLAEVPVRQYDIDDATRRLWRQELNKIHGEHDAKRDALEYDHLLGEGYTEEVEALTDAADEDLDELLAELRMEGGQSPAYEYDPEHNVYFEDCVEGMRERLDDDSVDCVITDPPYGIGYESGWDGPEAVASELGLVENDDSTDSVKGAYEQFPRVLRDNSHVYIFCRWDTFAAVHSLVPDTLELNTVIVWDKRSHTMGNLSTWANTHEFILHYEYGDPDIRGERPQNIVRESAPTRLPGVDAEHQTQKPVSLIEHLVNKSTDNQDVILDPFMGSGTTAVAAIQNDREYIGFEVDEDNYRDVIERRIGEAKRQREASVNQED